MIVLVLLLYYGAILLPIGYLIATRRKGIHSKAMWKSMVCQILASIGVWGLIIWCYYAGYSEWFWAWAYNIPINVVFLLVNAMLLTSRRSSRNDSGG